jgi:hypothetical protein
LGLNILEDQKFNYAISPSDGLVRISPQYCGLYWSLCATLFSFAATLTSSLANLEGDETFDASLLGAADEVVQQRISDDELILIKGTKARTAASIILRYVHRPIVVLFGDMTFRGANDFMLDEMERSVHDSLCVVRRVLESRKVVAGGGAVEAALNVYLENFATSLVSVSHRAVFFLIVHMVNSSIRFVSLTNFQLRHPHKFKLTVDVFRRAASSCRWRSLPTRYWSFRRRWLQTQRRTAPIWSPNCAPSTTSRRPARNSSI